MWDDLVFFVSNERRISKWSSFGSVLHVRKCIFCTVFVNGIRLSSHSLQKTGEIWCLVREKLIIFAQSKIPWFSPDLFQLFIMVIKFLIPDFFSNFPDYSTPGILLKMFSWFSQTVGTLRFYEHNPKFTCEWKCGELGEILFVCRVCPGDLVEVVC